MSSRPQTPGSQTFSALRRFARPRTPIERCEWCGSPLAKAHRHLLEIANRRIVCACDACALRFSEVAGGRYRLVPRDAIALPEFKIDDAEWEELALPIDLVFLTFDSAAGRLAAHYPGPAGATESLLRLDAWGRLVGRNPALARMAPDVEALLVNRAGVSRLYYVVPIDLCFELVGLIRLHWRGLSGGAEVWREIEAFFERLQARAVVEHGR